MGPAQPCHSLRPANSATRWAGVDHDADRRRHGQPEGSVDGCSTGDGDPACSRASPKRETSDGRYSSLQRSGIPKVRIST